MPSIQRLIPLSLMFVLVAKAFAGPLYYDHPDQINLCTVRGAVATTSKNRNAMPPADLPLHEAYGEIRFRSNYGACWWMVELPQAYKVSSIKAKFREVITSVGFKVKSSVQPLDDAGWAGVTPVLDFRGLLQGAGAPDPPGWAAGTFKPVTARFVRLEFYGHNGAEKGEAGKNHSDLVMSRVILTGPNNPAMGPAISLAQSLWAGGRATLNGADCPDAIDDMVEKSAWGDVHFFFFTDGSPNDASYKPQNKPASFVVTLAHRSLVEAMAYSAITTDRMDRPRDVRVYTSPYEIGEQWTLQKEAHDIPGGLYEEYAFDRPVMAKRVRLDVTRVWNPDLDKNSKLAFGHMGELYVFGTPQPPDFTYTIRHDAVTSAVVYESSGKKVRTLWTLRDSKAGAYGAEWDGLDDAFQETSKGPYEVRIISNAGQYRNVAAIGNTGFPPDPDGHIPVGVQSVAIDEEGSIYSANGWDEAGHDWKKWDRDGKSLNNSRYQIRNGDPNGLPYRIVVDDHYLYAAYISHNGMAKPGSEWVHRADRTTGKNAPWANAVGTQGLIQVAPFNEKGEMRWLITDLALAGKTLLVGDKVGGRVLKFDKETGESAGEFPVEKPGAMAVDSQGRLWMVQDDTKVTVFDLDGKELAHPLKDLDNASNLAFGPDGRLFLVDSKNDQLRIYDVKDTTATFVRTFGHEAQPGESASDGFYNLVDAAVAADGTVVTVQHLPVGGTRMASWTKEFKLRWEQQGLEFTGNGAYLASDPTVFVSSYFHRYKLEPKTGRWSYAGDLYTGRHSDNGEWHGAPRWVVIGGKRFFYSAIGDGMQVFRLDGDALRFCAYIGGCDPDPKGLTGKTKRGRWTWRDVNNDGRIQDEEIDWFKQPGEAGADYACFGMNVDMYGNVIFCNQYDHTIDMLPLQGLNASGSPIYDWSKLQVIGGPDKDSPVKFEPTMAVRTENQFLYALGKSGQGGLYPQPAGSGPAWMAGWVLAKFDPAGKRIWTTVLPNACPGLDLVPGGRGVVCGYFANANIWHLNSDGVLVGVCKPGDAAGGASGWLDNTASVAANVNPVDKLIDVFAEEDYAHRILWYRCDDSKISVTKQTIVRK